MDWNAWHKLYSENRPLKKRLRLVRRHLASALKEAPGGEISLLSICAGEARDLSGVLSRHKRAKDVRADLIEIDTTLVEQGRAAFQLLKLDNQVRYHNADATLARTYEGRPPAQILMACGMVGLVSSRTTPGLAELLAAMTAPRGILIWTRSLSLRSGFEHMELFRGALERCSFVEIRTDTTPDRLFRRGQEPRFVVASYRHVGAPCPLPAKEKLFDIVDL